MKSSEFSKNFSGFFFSPIQIKKFSLIIIPDNPLNVSEKDMIPFDPIGISTFSPYDLCMLETNNNFEQCKRLPIESIINKPITVSISPINKSLGNLSISITQVI